MLMDGMYNTIFFLGWLNNFNHYLVKDQKDIFSAWEKKSNLLHYFIKKRGKERFNLLYLSDKLFLSPPNWGVVNYFLCPLPSPPLPSLSTDFVEHTLKSTSEKMSCW